MSFISITIFFLLASFTHIFFRFETCWCMLRMYTSVRVSKMKKYKKKKHSHLSMQNDNETSANERKSMRTHTTPFNSFFGRTAREQACRARRTTFSSILFSTSFPPSSLLSDDGEFYVHDRRWSGRVSLFLFLVHI